VFIVQHVKPGALFGLLGSTVVPLGKASVPLDTLLSETEVHQELDIMDAANPRKSTGAKLEVRIRMKTPLLKAHVMKRSEQWMNLQFSLAGNASSVSLTASTQELVTSKPVTPPSASKKESDTIASGAIPVTEKSTNAVPKATSPEKPIVQKPDSPDIDTLELQFLKYSN
jgi:hypothetical protein